MPHSHGAPSTCSRHTHSQAEHTVFQWAGTTLGNPYSSDDVQEKFRVLL